MSMPAWLAKTDVEPTRAWRARRGAREAASGVGPGSSATTAATRRARANLGVTAMKYDSRIPV